MLAIRAQTPLFDQLEGGAVSCGFENQSLSRFLPQSLLDEKITKDNIAANLSLFTRVYSYWSDHLPNQIHLQAKKVFAILVLITEPWAIENLITKDDITDQDLPLFRRDAASTVLVSHATGKIFTAFQSWQPVKIRDFLREQWAVLAPVLDTKGKELKIDSECPLPIEKSEVRATGSEGVFVYRAWLHPAHLHPSSMSKTSSVAIKEIRSREVFLREKENLDRIQGLGHPHLIELFASCEKGLLYYFIFPWADGGDLREFWRLEDDTTRSQEFTLWSLEQVLGIVDAVKTLHKEGIRHGDIKPQNILHFVDPRDGEEMGRGRLVLADVGVSKYHRDATALRNSATNTSDVTILYEAPEAESDRQWNLPRSRRYDMWSMGCMFLEFTVWLLYGFDAVEVFRARRISSKDDPTTAPGNFFRHPRGQPAKIHTQVLKAMRCLRKDARCENGTALADLLNLIEEHLLRIEPEQRAEASDLHRRLDVIVTKAQNDPSYLCKQIDERPVTPRFFVRRLKGGRQYSNSSQSSSASASSIWSSNSSTEQSLDSVESSL